MKNHHLFIFILISTLIHLFLILVPINYSNLYTIKDREESVQTSSIFFELTGNKFVNRELRPKRRRVTSNYRNKKDVLAEYRIILENRIQNNLYIPYTLKKKNIDLSSLVEIDINRDGTLSGINLIKHSGNALIDKLVISAIKDASPFPPLPISYKKKNLKVALPLRFSVRTNM